MFTRLMLAAALLLLPTVALAQPSYTSELDRTGVAVYNSANPTEGPGNLYAMLGIILNALLGTLGVVLLVLIIYASFLWMTAAGNSDQVSKAKSILVNAVAGIVLLVASFAIANFVVAQLSNTGDTSSSRGSATYTTSSGSGGGGIFTLEGALLSVGIGANLSGASIFVILGILINIFLGLMGIVLLVLVIYAGFLWMTAGGNADQVAKAKRILVQAVVGLVIMLAAYAITNFVVAAADWRPEPSIPIEEPYILY